MAHSSQKTSSIKPKCWKWLTAAKNHQQLNPKIKNGSQQPKTPTIKLKGWKWLTAAKNINNCIKR